VSFWAYVTSSSFAVDVAENWQSEYVHFFLMIVATVWLVRRGSTEPRSSRHRQGVRREAEGRPVHRGGLPPGAKAGGWRTVVYSRSLATIMAMFFLGSLAQSVAGRAAFNAEQPADSYAAYVTSADFWNRTMQNWQSEFLVVCSTVLFSSYLRQRGSPESKPVGARTTQPPMRARPGLDPAPAVPDVGLCWDAWSAGAACPCTAAAADA
jgi:hypothetical protein